MNSYFFGVSHWNNQRFKLISPIPLEMNKIPKLCGLRQGFETWTRPYGPTEKATNLSVLQFFSFKNHSMGKKQGSVRTVVGPYGFENCDRFLRFGRFLFSAKFRPILQQYFGVFRFGTKWKGEKKKKKNKNRDEEEGKKQKWRNQPSQQATFIMWTQACD